MRIEMTNKANVISTVLDEQRVKQVTVSKRCNMCGMRLFDKMTRCSGIIEMKCPRCRNYITLDMSCRLSV